MQEDNKPTGPDEQPVVAGWDDVDQLLAEAERLAEEVVEQSGGGMDADVAGRGDSPQNAESQGVLAVAEGVEARLGELSSELGSRDGGEAASGNTLLSRSPAVDPPPAADDISGETQSEDHSGGAIAQPPAAKQRRSEGAVCEAAQDRPTSPFEGIEPAHTSRPLATARPAARGSCRDFCRAVPSAALLVIPRFLTRLLAIIDRPFAQLPPTTKRCIGYVAIATLLVGISSFFLPALLEKNPYLDYAQ